MDTRASDKKASDLQEGGLTWSAVATEMHFANGSVARRCAMRHRQRNETVDAPAVIKPKPIPVQLETVDPSTAEPITTMDEAVFQNHPTCFVPADVLYHRTMPKASFKFVKWNRDGSAEVWGGEAGHPMYRNFRIEDLSATPMTPLEALGRWAELNLFEILSVDEMAERFNAKPAAVRLYVNARPDQFRRAGHGKYETRDPQADRAADRRSA